MKNRFVVGLALALLEVAAPARAQSDPAPEETGIFRVGQPVPPLELPTIDGRSTIHLASLAGQKAIVLQFASW